jgi:hypothetical protein
MVQMGIRIQNALIVVENSVISLFANATYGLLLPRQFRATALVREV